MSTFDNELQGYLESKSREDEAEKRREVQEQDSQHSHNTFSTSSLTQHTHDSQFDSPFPHPDNFVATPEAPQYAQDPVTRMWHDAITGTFSYYSDSTGVYIPVEGPNSYDPTLTRDDHMGTYHQHSHSDLYTGYPVDQQLAHTGAQTYEAPPESDSSLRLCVISSNALKVGGVIMIDGSGISFGRDKPLSGQGKRVRMVEMDVSRFHATIHLDRQQVESFHDISIHNTEVTSEPGARPTFRTDSPHLLSNVENLDGTILLPEQANNITEPTSTLIPESSDVAHDTASPSPCLDTPKMASSPTSNTFTQPMAEIIQPSQDPEDGELPDSPTENSPTEKSTEVSKAKNSAEDVLHDYRAKLGQYYGQLRLQQQQQQQLQQHDAIYPVFMDTFQITDCGSTHGTMLNGERLSTPRTASQPFALKHKDRLQLGSTLFEVHIHEDGRVCASCQIKDDNEIDVLDDKERDEVRPSKSKSSILGDLKANIEQERIEEMNRLRKKWAGPNNKRQSSHSVSQGGGSNTAASAEYVDRAAKRRLHHPDTSQPVPSMTYPIVEEAVTGFHVPVASTSKGHAMLSKMGWKAGTGLGASRQGVVEPVQLVVADSKAGLGSANLRSQGASAARKPETQGEAARRRARERFAQLG
ncbi:Angiogenic factor with G patch and FHA domains 1 [Podila humilis]|nr:Angiogenic factor with G patch and FHA domains 1 [Podila humilis]